MHFEWMLAAVSGEDDVLVKYDQMYAFPHTVFDFLEPWPAWADVESVPRSLSVFSDGEDVQYHVWEVSTRSCYRSRLQHTHGRNIVRSSRGGVMTGFKKAKLHKRGVDRQRGFLQRLKKALAALKPTKGHLGSVYDGHAPFERGLIDRLDQMRMAEIRAAAVGEDGAEKDEQDSVYEDTVTQVSGLEILEETRTVDKPGSKAVASTFTLSGLLSELKLNGSRPKADAVSFEARSSSSTQWNRYQSLIVPAPAQVPELDSGPVTDGSLSGAEIVVISNSLRMRKNNFFYKPGISLEQGAVQIVRILRAAHDGCDSWLQLRADQFKRALQRSTRGTAIFEPLTQMCGDLDKVKQLLVTGREGWDLATLGDEFFVDALGVMPMLPAKLKEMSKREGLEWLDGRALATVAEIEKALRCIKERRKMILLQGKSSGAVDTRTIALPGVTSPDGERGGQEENNVRQSATHATRSETRSGTDKAILKRTLVDH